MYPEVCYAGFRKGEKWLMSNNSIASQGQEKIQRLVVGILLLSLLVLGTGGLGVASDTHSLLQIQGDRITGALNQVPLRTVLEQLQEKLAIEYVVPGEELDKPVSANLAGEPVIKTLSKILASWDYALQVDQQGKVHKIFVVGPKMGPMGIEKNEVKTSEAKMALPPEREMASSPEKDVMGSPMDIVLSEQLPPMVIQPPQGGEMIIQPSSDIMEVIPASGYQPMEILPASEDAQMEFIEGHK
jgi:type II secretory pathway component GspD/PulD (secretin)